jgi:acyl-CoA thioester hydrolase
MGVVVANLQQDFERPLGRADAVEVGVGVPRLREKSFPFEYEGRSPVGVHAVGETTMAA